MELVITLTTLVLSAFGVIGSTALRLHYNKKIAMEYLAWAIFSCALWNLAKAGSMQFLFENEMASFNLSVLLLLFLPLPFSFYLDEVQRGRYRKEYRMMRAVLLTAIGIFFVLHLAGIRTFVENATYILVLWTLTILFMCSTMALDLFRGRIKEYSLVAGTLMLVWLMAISRELGYFNRGAVKTGTILPFGMIILLLLAAGNTFHELLDMERKKQEALSASEAKGRFLANMSHEIRTPINAVLGMNTMILRECTDAQIREYAMDIQSAGQSLLSLINDILDLSKIESGKLDIIPEEYDFSSLIHDIVNMIGVKAKDKGLALDLSVDENLPSRLFGDDIRLRQILVNLMNNAVKYTEKGTVFLRIRGTAADDSVSLDFEVEDTGIGIKEEDLPKLFAEFERIESERNRKVEGTGLGMSITTQLLDLMGSRLNVESEYGTGSRFYFTVKQKIISKEPIGNLKERIHANAANYSYQTLFTAPNAQVLVVDDNEVNRKVFRNLLKKTKVTVDEAAGGLECLEMVRKKEYDVIFLDHMMPDLDGIETLHRMKDLPDILCPSAPVVALTANAVAGARERYLAEGFHSFLSKPIDPDHLEKLLTNLLPSEKIDYSGAQETAPIEDDAAGESRSCEEQLPQIDGIDWKYALLYTKDAELLWSTVEDFYRLMETDADQLEQQLREADWKQFQIKVHAMKSSAASVGALSLSGIAKMLEYAARDGKADVVEKVTPPFLEEWRQMQELLKPYIEDGEENSPKREPDYPMIRQYLPLLLDALEQMDVDGADAIIEQLLGYAYPENMTSAVKGLEQATANLDAGQAAEWAQVLERKIEEER